MIKRQEHRKNQGNTLNVSLVRPTVKLSNVHLELLYNPVIEKFKHRERLNVDE